MEFSLQESAEILGITVKNVKVRLHRGRKKLKAILEEKCAFERDERDVLICTPARDKEVTLPEENVLRKSTSVLASCNTEGGEREDRFNGHKRTGLPR